MKIDKDWLRQFVLSIVKPLRSGKVEDNETDNKNYGLKDVYPDGYAKSFRMTFPFGMVARVPKGITAFFNSLFGSGHENIIAALLHHDRPVVNNIGEVVFYSTNSTGKQIKTTIKLTNDGKLVINCPDELQIVCTNATLNAQTTIVNSPTTTINASTKTTINSPVVEVGSGALEKVLNGETFQTWFNNHTHIGNLGYPTSKPNEQSIPAHLSTKVKAAK